MESQRTQRVNGFEEAVKDICQIMGRDGARLWNTSLLLMPEFASERWVRALEKRGFWVSTGAACAAGKSGAFSCACGYSRRPA